VQLENPVTTITTTAAEHADPNNQVNHPMDAMPMTTKPVWPLFPSANLEKSPRPTQPHVAHLARELRANAQSYL